MQDRYPPSVAHYDPPFAPADFYYLPVGWLRDTRKPGELDTLDLLFFLLDDTSGLAYFRAERDRMELMRDGAEPGPADPATPHAASRVLPILVSHTTFDAQVKALAAAGKLELLGGRPAGFRIAHWPTFDGQPPLYRPRLYVDMRWPHWFGKGAWRPRVALLAFLARLREAHAGQRLKTDPLCDALVVATANELRELAARLCAAPNIRSEVGPGLERLVRLNVVSRVAGGLNPRYGFRIAALAEPPGWSAATIARLCGLDAHADAAMITLLETCLKSTQRPVSAAPAMWRMLRTNWRALATPEDVAGFEAAVGRAMPRTVAGLRGLLKDYLAERAAEEAGVWGDEFGLEARDGALADGQRLPEPGRVRPMALQLVIKAERERLSIHDTIGALGRAQVFVLQGERRVLLADTIRADAYAVKRGLIMVGCNHALTALAAGQPFTVGLRWEAPPAGLKLLCRFRLLGPSLAGRIPRPRP